MDPYLKPTYPVRNRIRRALWTVVQHWVFALTPRPMFAVRAWILRAFGASIGRRNFIYPKAQIWAPWLLRTGDVVTIADRVEVYNPGGVRLLDHAIVSQGAFLCGATHDIDDPAFRVVPKPIVLMPYAWVCSRAIVLPGVHVGEGAVLGAGAVAGRALTPWTVYAGNPATKVRERKRPVSAG
jgi:putative colanic acid biosynthesis acetyltransferase WcaF